MSASGPELALAHAISAIGKADFQTLLYRWICLIGEIDNGAMIAFFKDRGPEAYFSEAQDRRVFANLDSHYLRGAYLLDPVYSLHVKHADEGLYRLIDISPDHFRRNEYFASYFRRTTLIDELIFLAHPAPGVTITICVGRDATSGRKFSARTITRLRETAPIVAALANAHWGNLRSETETDDLQVVEALRNRLSNELKISLSPRQSEIAFLVLQGHSSVSIGLTLGISPLTVKTIRKQLYRKCNISSQAELFSLLTPYLLRT
ncbi:helix-turn-helix transcriptional regulator [Aliisedimentitalea scapharcae]|uniref:Helix-turn-helix transcriptional regulator n=1 Tax=Aliisedimentitalea scapharcae TaxID=1524259 RepID=A0ABZ2XUW5_9RHOB